MNVLALEPFYGGSHRHFIDGLARHSRHTFRLVTMADRYWKWRMHGGAVTLADGVRRALQDGFRPDVLFATSMVNLPAVLALARRELAGVPVVLYLHENQLTYPLAPGRERGVAFAYQNYLSALAADRVVFNSAFHRDEFLGALPNLLARYPDHSHPGTLAAIRAKSQVLYLGLDLAGHDAHRQRPNGRPRDARGFSTDGPPTLLWNQRWDHDKNPEAFFRAIGRLDDAGVDFRLILAGTHYDQGPVPEPFEQAFRRYAERIVHYGFAEGFAAYSALLHRADVVVSTARHEFFGIAILEAVYCGAHPVLPARLTYPELIPETLHRPLLHAGVLYKNEDELFDLLRGLLTGRERPLPPDVLRSIAAPLAWPEQAPRYDALFENVAGSRAL